MVKDDVPPLPLLLPECHHEAVGEVSQEERLARVLPVPDPHPHFLVEVLVFPLEDQVGFLVLLVPGLEEEEAPPPLRGEPVEGDPPPVGFRGLPKLAVGEEPEVGTPVTHGDHALTASL